jgi:hypothetical protein
MKKLFHALPSFAFSIFNCINYSLKDVLALYTTFFIIFFFILNFLRQLPHELKLYANTLISTFLFKWKNILSVSYLNLHRSRLRRQRRRGRWRSQRSGRKQEKSQRFSIFLLLLSWNMFCVNISQQITMRANEGECRELKIVIQVLHLHCKR